MNIPEKERKSIANFFDKFKANTFLENDLKLFLIEVREYLNGETFLRELADFIAHGTRNQGMCFKAVKSRHMRMSSMGRRMKDIMTDEFMEKNKGKPDSFFSRSFLNYLDYRKISLKDFKIYFTYSLDDLEESFVMKQTGMDKARINGIIKSSYQREGNYMFLDHNLSEEKKLLIEELLLFIRGAITTQAVFTQKQIEKDFKMVASKFSNSEFKEDHSQAMNDLMVCIMAMLHDKQFKLDNHSFAHCYLNIQNKNNIMEELQASTEWEINVNVNAANFSFPLITSEINPANYIENFDQDRYAWTYSEAMTEIYTRRDKDGKLRLVNEN